MFGRKSLNNSKIAKGSNNNVVIQDSTIGTNILCNNSPELISFLGKMGEYELIQKQVVATLSAARKTHPLFPDFSALPSAELGRLVSTPETSDAFAKYPKKIKGAFEIDYKKYPYMDKSETPWEYAYRTQTRVELKTTAYREYLGDIEDPFPTVEYCDGMVSTICAPEFPAAVSATIQSGEVAINIQLRRKPCLEYGKMIFGTVSNEQGFDFSLTTYENVSRTDFNIKKVPSLDLNILLARERLINEIAKTKQICVKIGDAELLSATLNEDELSEHIFKASPYLVAHIENLITIEKHTGCTFDASAIGDIYTSDYRAAYILASSLEGKWHQVKTEFCDETRCDYDHICGDFSENSSSDMVIEGNVVSVALHGLHFSAERYIVVYRDAKVNNWKSVLKRKRKEKKNILITFRPIAGKEHFSKFYYFENIKWIDNRTK